MTEVQKIKNAIIFFEDKIKSQGMITNARDNDQLIRLKELLKEISN